MLLFSDVCALNYLNTILDFIIRFKILFKVLFNSFKIIWDTMAISFS